MQRRRRGAVPRKRKCPRTLATLCHDYRPRTFAVGRPPIGQVRAPQHAQLHRAIDNKCQRDRVLVPAQKPLRPVNRVKRPKPPRRSRAAMIDPRAHRFRRRVGHVPPTKCATLSSVSAASNSRRCAESSSATSGSLGNARPSRHPTSACAAKSATVTGDLSLLVIARLTSSRSTSRTSNEVWRTVSTANWTSEWVKSKDIALLPIGSTKREMIPDAAAYS